jgi:hypothetical protein
MVAQYHYARQWYDFIYSTYKYLGTKNSMKQWAAERIGGGGDLMDNNIEKYRCIYDTCMI